MTQTLKNSKDITDVPKKYGTGVLDKIQLWLDTYVWPFCIIAQQEEHIDNLHQENSTLEECCKNLKADNKLLISQLVDRPLFDIKWDKSVNPNMPLVVYIKEPFNVINSYRDMESFDKRIVQKTITTYPEVFVNSLHIDGKYIDQIFKQSKDDKPKVEFCERLAYNLSLDIADKICKDTPAKIYEALVNEQ